MKPPSAISAIDSTEKFTCLNMRKNPITKLPQQKCVIASDEARHKRLLIIEIGEIDFPDMNEPAQDIVINVGEPVKEHLRNSHNRRLE